MKYIWLLDDSLRVEVYYDCNDCDYSDNICVSFREVAAPNEKIFAADETNIYLTPEQANEFALALIRAAKQSMGLEKTVSNMDDPE
ncbi:MAG: hypothetical protein IAE79_28710 [Anaerolinea sp.]|nr:hypothetical protein [Anaerolinea sp.]